MSENGSRLPFYETVYMRARKFLPPELLKRRLSLHLEDDDVVIASGPKSGTTWTQHILHALRSRGHLDYEDIHDVSPVLELAEHGGNDEDIHRMFLPRLYKTHSLCEECPAANKTIVLTRNPNNAVLSSYHYLCHWFFEPEELDLDGFIESVFQRTFPADCLLYNAYQMRHLASWYPHRKADNILWLHYEDLKADLPKCIRLMAEFIGIELDDQLLELVTHQASIEFMKEHITKFDSHKMKLSMNELAGLDKHAGLREKSSQKVRAGHVNESKEVFTEKAKQMIQKKWNEILKPVTGFDNYEDMRAAVNVELSRQFPA